MAEVKLSPTQDLVLDVLAARWRLGEKYWTFNKVLYVRTLIPLHDAGLITMTEVSHGIGAALTAQGQAEVLRPTYQPPNGGYDRLKRALEAILEYAQEREDIVIGMKTVADTARLALGRQEKGQ